jgi:hypothetical protein
MPLRILTGIVAIGPRGPKSGNVRIQFNPHRRIDGDANVTERGTVGPAGRFAAVPAKHVALRQITLIDTDAAINRFTVNDAITRDALRISWKGRGASFSEEISYLVVGEVPEPLRPPPGRLPRKPRGVRQRRR